MSVNVKLLRHESYLQHPYHILVTEPADKTRMLPPFVEPTSLIARSTAAAALNPLAAGCHEVTTERRQKQGDYPFLDD